MILMCYYHHIHFNAIPQVSVSTHSNCNMDIPCCPLSRDNILFVMLLCLFCCSILCPSLRVRISSKGHETVEDCIKITECVGKYINMSLLVSYAILYQASMSPQIFFVCPDMITDMNNNDSVLHFLALKTSVSNYVST